MSQHLEDAWRVSNQLWEHWLSDGQKETIIQSLNPASEEVAKSLLVFLAAAHDLGKITTAFQIKTGWSSSSDLDDQLIEQLEYEGFDGLSHATLSKSSASPHALAGQALLQKFGVSEEIASIIGGHHGAPVESIVKLKRQLSYPANYFQNENPNHPVYQKWLTSQQIFFERAMFVAGFDGVNELPQITQRGQVLLSGVLIMADWIASNEDYFPLIDWENYEPIDQMERFKAGWEKWNMTWPIHFKDIGSLDEIYQMRFGFDPRHFQKEFGLLIEDCEEPGIFVLEAPMGLGKTEAALIGAEQLAHKTGRSGLFFALPTQATSDSMFSRVKHWLDKVIESYDEKVSIQLMHGKAALNKDFADLAHQVNIDDPEETVQVNQWFSGRKKTILDDYIVGTIDQLLLIALKQKHLALRHLGFSKKVVIIDEAHANDTYMNEYLMMALRWLGAYRVPVIVLSATLPQETREKMVLEYLRGKGLKRKDIQYPEDNFKIDDYPLVTYTDGHQLKQYSAFSSDKEVSKTIQIKKLDEDQVWEKLDEWSASKGNIGIIVNTVSRAQEIARDCSKRYGEDIVEVLHSSFIATDRKKKEQALLDTIGKNAKRPERKIIIGTQVIEQSLDIDFDVLISDLAPMDLLIQRVGRLHRHTISRPDQHMIPILYIMGCDDSFDFEGGSSAVYGDYLLMRTQYFLPNQLIIPEDISTLVQKVYSHDEIELDSSLAETYQTAKDIESSRQNKKKKRAQSYLLSEPEKRRYRHSPISLIGWLSHIHPNQTEEYGYAQVRDSDESIEVIAVKQCGDGYSLFGTDEDISGDIYYYKTARKVAKNTIKLPGALSKNYNIEEVIERLEKYNKKYLYDWQDQPWLKGHLGIVFDDHNQFEIDNIRNYDYILTYSEKYGLSMERKDKDESI